ncbi:MAG: hypothetical protein SangKO_025280 [Sandaracinaceae bacterium]
MSPPTSPPPASAPCAGSSSRAPSWTPPRPTRATASTARSSTSERPGSSSGSRSTNEQHRRQATFANSTPPSTQGWLGLRGALEALARLIGTDAGNRASAILSQVFPSDGEFLRFTYPDQWAGSDLALIRIAERDLEEAINELVGPEYLPFIRSAHEAFGTALGLNANTPKPQDTAALRKAIGDLADFARLDHPFRDHLITGHAGT